MASHPYVNRPASAYWRRAVAGVADRDLDPMNAPPFRISRKDRVATAGSCFAQHIGRYLQAADCTYLVTEPPHPLLNAEAARLTNYGVYTARYGNIYTARQLLQLFARAFGHFTPRENIWCEAGATYLDPFRPSIQPRGFNSERELDIDREQHFRAVREAFETLDVFIFTLGLTEAWASREDGAVFPVCPGVAGGSFSSERHAFVNFGVDDVVADLTTFIEHLRRVNPSAKFILTVSPVPLAATAGDRHVLEATVYSKSVLRVASELVSRHVTNVAYLPSYEIISSGFAGHYFARDKRTVTEEGVVHVMRVFASHFLDASPRSIADRLRRTLGGKPAASQTSVLSDVFRVMCDEEALDALDFDTPETRSVIDEDVVSQTEPVSPHLVTPKP